MKALTYHGSKDVRVETVADPRIVDADDNQADFVIAALIAA